jgi:hypothetical protein
MGVGNFFSLPHFLTGLVNSKAKDLYILISRIMDSQTHMDLMVLA